MNFRYARHTTI